ncbi:hypothetical protein BDW66DRAFT_169041 [Aspergillus desertorum]
MASIQRIAANALQITPEVNFSLLHANIDFSLRKFEAPTELVPLGERLSKQRRQLAEEGSFHILARRLGILFEEVLPRVPSLLEAYGTRASEIVRDFEKKGSPPKSVAEGIFGPHLGVDSTSIWAGATSGRPALLMHLLACMLARIWSPQEATAIWAELIEHRRQIVRRQAVDNDRTSALFAQQAAMYDTDWSTLQAWDASARAWLQIADDSVCKRQQKQIELIANNLSIAIQTQVTSDAVVELPVPKKENVYDSVIHNLYGALTTLDNLISGRPQRILDGGVLLGLTSWHLYPDLVILGPQTQDIHQKDPLVAEGGIATLSIAYEENPHGKQEGVYWSLPLANLRYYGTVNCKRSSIHDSRLSFPEFQALILGASLGSLDTLSDVAYIIRDLWAANYTTYQRLLGELNEIDKDGIPFGRESSGDREDEVLEDEVQTVKSKLQEGKQGLSDIMENLHLLSPLVGGVNLFSSGTPEDQKIASQLIRYGANAAKSWIGNTNNHPACLFGLSDLAVILQLIWRPKDRVRVLREILKPHSLSSDDYVIRFRRENNTWGYASLTEEGDSHHKKRTRDDFEADPNSEQWIFITSNWDFRNIRSSSAGDYGDYSIESWSTVTDDEDVYDSFVQDEPLTSATVIWDYVLGIHSLAAVYQKHNRAGKDTKTVSQNAQVPVFMIRNLASEGSLNLEATMAAVRNWLTSYQPDHYFSLLALGRIIDHYERELTNSTLTMSVIKQPPKSWTWMKSIVKDLELQHVQASSLARNGIRCESIYPCPLTRQQAFASILQFESGTLSVDVQEMDSVMAISSGNSLYIAQRLLHDPIPPETLASCAVAHAIGNVGKPGIALLFAPEKPDVREHDVERWHVVNHNSFDGMPSGGSFQGSSLHMSFTGWEGPLRVRGPAAFRGMEAYHLETQISMYDRGEWVADLNVLKSLQSSPDIATCGVYDRDCGHNPSAVHCGVKLVSIDCWEELLSPAERPMVLRSGASWMARLTAVSIAHSKGFKCFLLPTHKALCWTCVVEEADLCSLQGRTILFVY